jgi:uncharacterized protein (TIGR02147 family)
MISDFFPSDQRNYLQDELGRRKQRRPHYSMRAFARDLDISPAFLSEFLAGRHGLSRERTLWIARKLQLSQTQGEHFWDLIESKFGRSEEAKKTARIRALQRVKDNKNQLNLKHFQLIADWYNFALLEILTLPDSAHTTRELAETLKVPEPAIQESIARLVELDLIEIQSNGEKWIAKPKSEVTSTEKDGANRAVQIAHQQTLLMHADAIDHKAFHERESLSITLSLAQSDWPELKEELSEAVVKVLSKYSCNENKKNQAANFTMQIITLLPAHEGKK